MARYEFVGSYVSMLYREVRRRFTNLIGPVISACLVGYFTYHLIQGNHGLRAYWRLGDDLKNAGAKYTSLKENHDDLQNRVNLLRPNSICPDLLEEQVRKNLGYVHPNELVILNPEVDKKKAK
jgi:cell division protein FtsB